MILQVAAKHLLMLMQKYPDDNGNKNNRKKLKDLAEKIANKFGVKVSQTKNRNGFKFSIQRNGHTLEIRIMDSGSGGRMKPYIRISIPGKQAFDIYGFPSSDRALTHIDLDAITVAEIVQLIQKIMEEYL